MNSHIQANAYDLRARAFTNVTLWHRYMATFEVSHPRIRLDSHLYDLFDCFHFLLLLSVKIALISKMIQQETFET